MQRPVGHRPAPHSRAGQLPANIRRVLDEIRRRRPHGPWVAGRLAKFALPRAPRVSRRLEAMQGGLTRAPNPWQRPRHEPSRTLNQGVRRRGPSSISSPRELLSLSGSAHFTAPMALTGLPQHPISYGTGRCQPTPGHKPSPRPRSATGCSVAPDTWLKAENFESDPLSADLRVQ